MSEIQNGSCLCNKVKFEVIGEIKSFYFCHCKYCQKDTGSAHASNVFIAKTEFRWLSGEELIKNYQIPETRHKKTFCSECGSPLPHFQNDGKLVAIPAGSLDSNLNFKANAHIFMSSKANWESCIAEAPQFDKYPQK